MKFKPGDFVKYNAPTGSVGQIDSLNHYGGYYVTWVYGRDVAGDVMKSSFSSQDDKDLVPISEEEYLKIRDRKGWGEDQ